jgi:NitT/TauT family transport system ATP-binding protein
MVTTEQPQVEYRSVARHFVTDKSAFVAVHDISLTVARGEFVCIVGPSGCGKSTLLNMAAGLLRASEGTVLYNGKPVTGINTDTGYMTQRDTLLPWRTVERNVALPLECHRMPRGDRNRKVREILTMVGLDEFRTRYPSELSGGMLKRTALAQTLVYEPATLLMDEPFGALDAQLRLTLQQELLAIWERTRTTIIFVTHDLEEAILLADRVVVFGTAPGRIIHVEDVDLPRPRDLDTLRTDPRFTGTWERLWKLLRPQMGGAE